MYVYNLIKETHTNKAEYSFSYILLEKMVLGG